MNYKPLENDAQVEEIWTQFREQKKKLEEEYQKALASVMTLTISSGKTIRKETLDKYSTL